MFGDNGGYDMILKKIQNKEKDKWCPIELTTHYVKALGNIG